MCVPQQCKVQFTTISVVEEWYIMKPNLSGWGGERGTVFVQQSNCLGIKAIGHSGGPEETCTSYQRAKVGTKRVLAETGLL